MSAGSLIALFLYEFERQQQSCKKMCVRTTHSDWVHFICTHYIITNIVDTKSNVFMNSKNGRIIRKTNDPTFLTSSSSQHRGYKNISFFPFFFLPSFVSLPPLTFLFYFVFYLHAYRVASTFVIVYLQMSYKIYGFLLYFYVFCSALPYPPYRLLTAIIVINN